MPDIKAYDLGEDFSKRLDAAKSSKDQARSKDFETWKVSEGNYGTPFFESKAFRFTSREKPLDLVESEVVMFDILKQKLLEHERDQTGPVLALDIGGMYGSTWCRLACHFENEVRAGKLRLIVSSLNNDKQNIHQAFAEEMRADPFSNDTVEAFQKGHALVEYVRADLPELWERLKGKVDLVFEEFSLAHSFTPETDFALAAECMNPRGIFIAKDDGPHPGVGSKEEQAEKIKTAFQVAIGNLNKRSNNIRQKIGANANIWSPSKFAEQYFKKQGDYPRVIQYPR